MTDQLTSASIDELNAVLGHTEGEIYIDSVDTIRDRHTGRILKNSYDGSDADLIVHFTTEAVYHKLKSHRAGMPQYIDMDFISINCPGNTLVSMHGPVTEYYKWRFPLDYDAFKKGQGELITGTPLALWPLLSQSQIKELTYLNVRTVEQLANLSDSSAPKIAGFHNLKAQAKQFLALAKDKAEQGRLQVELDQRDASHKAELATMQAQMDNMMRLLEANAAAKSEEPATKPRKQA